MTCNPIGCPSCSSGWTNTRVSTNLCACPCVQISTTPTSTPTPTPTNSAGQDLWGQCGGIGWTGLTVCKPPAKCQWYNDWYSESWYQGSNSMRQCWSISALGQCVPTSFWGCSKRLSIRRVTGSLEIPYFKRTPFGSSLVIGSGCRRKDDEASAWASLSWN